MAHYARLGINNVVIQVDSIDNNKIINEGGVNGTGQGVVNVNSKDYKIFQCFHGSCH